MKIALILMMATTVTIVSTELKATQIDSNSDQVIRVPAEWEPQEAVWLQWPGRYEKTFETAFAAMSAVIVQYQKLHVLCHSKQVERQARAAIEKTGTDPDHTNLVWHITPNDSAWMRDNGPVYVIVNDQMHIQNWEFNAWGGAFGADIAYSRDNEVPRKVGEYLDLPVDDIDIVHERGNLEFNGVDTVIANWSTLGDPDRNPGYSKQQAIADLKHHFGVSKVVLIEGIPESDLTKGHIDGIARFISPTTVVVSQCTTESKCRPGDGRDDEVYEAAARIIQEAGFQVIRDPMEATVRFQGQIFDTNYVNWIVGNGFVIVVGFGNAVTDAAAKARIQSYYPDRDVHVIEMLQSWASGGGAHCHTNDQPAFTTVKTRPASERLNQADLES